MSPQPIVNTSVTPLVVSSSAVSLVGVRPATSMPTSRIATTTSALCVYVCGVCVCVCVCVCVVVYHVFAVGEHGTVHSLSRVLLRAAAACCSDAALLCSPGCTSSAGALPAEHATASAGSTSALRNAPAICERPAFLMHAKQTAVGGIVAILRTQRGAMDGAAKRRCAAAAVCAAAAAARAAVAAAKETFRPCEQGTAVRVAKFDKEAVSDLCNVNDAECARMDGKNRDDSSRQKNESINYVCWADDWVMKSRTAANPDAFCSRDPCSKQAEVD